MYGFTRAVHRNGHRHVFDLELVDRFHAQFGEGHDSGFLDRLSHQVRSAADGHQVHGFVVADCVDGGRAAFGFADHAQQAGLVEDLAGELIHPRGRGRACRANDFFAYRINRADVVDETTLEVDRQGFALVEHFDHALVRGVAAGKHLAVEQHGFARLPALHFFRGQGVEVDSAGRWASFPDDFRVGVQRRRFQRCRAAAVEHEVRVAGGRAVGDHAHRQRSGVGRVVHDLDVEHGGQTTQALSADAQLVDLFEQLQTHLFDAALRAAGRQLMNVDGLHQHFLGHDRCLFRGAADADAEHARWAPACAHGWNGFQDPVDDRVGRVEHRHLRFVFRTTAFRRDVHFHGITWNDGVVDNSRGVVLGVFASACRVGEDRGTQHVFRQVVSATHAFVDHVVQAHGGAIPANIHTHAYENGNDTGVLADRAMTGRAHARVDQDLSDGVASGRRLFTQIRLVHGLDEIHGVVVGNELQCVCNALNQVVLLDHGHAARSSVRAGTFNYAIGGSLELRLEPELSG
ncbi:hypothetical protein ALQ67_103941 [Pseudomonas savastanoi pv. glycinea]|nr:hypothetical protein ALQ67_103941 [Pseudomonas savastanoi pv. glycinea]